jgi:heme-degrading monooxygenase HmoA
MGPHGSRSGVGAVTVHRFNPGVLDINEFAAELQAFVHEARAHLDGLTRVMVLRAEGGNDVAVLAEWRDRQAQTAGTEILYRDDRLARLRARGGVGRHDAYIVVAISPEPGRDGSSASAAGDDH